MLFVYLRHFTNTRLYRLIQRKSEQGLYDKVMDGVGEVWPGIREKQLTVYCMSRLGPVYKTNCTKKNNGCTNVLNTSETEMLMTSCVICCSYLDQGRALRSKCSTLSKLYLDQGNIDHHFSFRSLIKVHLITRYCFFYLFCIPVHLRHTYRTDSLLQYWGRVNTRN